MSREREREYVIRTLAQVRAEIERLQGLKTDVIACTMRGDDGEPIIRMRSRWALIQEQRGRARALQALARTLNLDIPDSAFDL